MITIINDFHFNIWCRKTKEDLGMKHSIVNYISLEKMDIGYEVFIDCKHRRFSIDGDIGGWDGEFTTDGICLLDENEVVHNIEWNVPDDMVDCFRLDSREKNQITLYYINKDLLFSKSKIIKSFENPKEAIFNSLHKLDLV
jgi:hypothetical protein